MPPFRVVDTHAHIISSDPARYPRAPTSGALPEWLADPDRRMDADTLRARMSEAGVAQAVLVQYSSAHGYDNAYVLDTAAAQPETFVAVCTIDGRRPDAPELLGAVAKHGAAGIRIRAPNRDVSLEWLDCEPLLQRAMDLDMPVCIHFMESAHLEGMQRLQAILRNFPRLRVVLDHAGNPPWRDGLTTLLELAPFEHLYIKFATINLERLQHANLAPQVALERLIGGFSARRIMWGSDAPNTPGNYTHMVNWMASALSSVSDDDRHWIMGGTALDVYPRLAAHGVALHAGMSFA